MPGRSSRGAGWPTACPRRSPRACTPGCAPRWTIRPSPTTPASRRAAELGWSPTIGDLRIEGEAREAALRLIGSAEGLAPRTCLIGGGETTVTVRGDGVGGRNTELALAAAIAIDGRADLAVAALATDGDDGASGSAGAVVTGETLARGRALGLDAADYLARNDSATYLRLAGGLLVTGPTQTNVADLYCVLVEGARDEEWGSRFKVQGSRLGARNFEL
jgi:glycerate 2-kinase